MSCSRVHIGSSHPTHPYKLILLSHHRRRRQFHSFHYSVQDTAAHTPRQDFCSWRLPESNKSRTAALLPLSPPVPHTLFHTDKTLIGPHSRSLLLPLRDFHYRSYARKPLNFSLSDLGLHSLPKSSSYAYQKKCGPMFCGSSPSQPSLPTRHAPFLHGTQSQAARLRVQWRAIRCEESIWVDGSSWKIG